MTKPENMTKAQRIHWNYAIDARRMIEHDLHSVAAKRRCLPPEWDIRRVHRFCMLSHR